MDLYCVVGWDDMDAFNVLQSLRAIPNNSNDDEFNPYEFSVSDAGIRHIQNELDMINQRFGTNLQWNAYPGDNFVLVWRNELQKSIGDPNEPPIQKYYIDHHCKDPSWNNLCSKFDIPCSPIVILISDAEVYYNTHVYDDENSPYNSDQEESVS